MLLIPAAIRKIKEEGRKVGRREVREEMKERLDEAYKRFGVDVDGVIGLPDTPEVWRFLNGEDVKPRKPGVDDIIRRSRFRRRYRSLMRVRRWG